MEAALDWKRSRGDETPLTETETKRYDRVLLDMLSWARDREYRGWDYGDGGSSKPLQWLPVENKWLNIAVQEIAKRPPINIRPLLGIEQRRNDMGIALFTMANLNVAHFREQLPETDFVDYRGEARRLIEWLLRNRREGYSGFCSGHNHPIQLLTGKGLPEDPDVVSTSYTVKALLAAGELEPRYPDIAKTAADFVESDLKYREAEGGAKINYHMNHPDDQLIINSAALGARLLSDLYTHFGDEKYREMAGQLLDHVAAKQTAQGGWYYSDPPSDSHLSMDTHHTAFIIESYLSYQESCDSTRYDTVLNDALSFFRNELFDSDGAPNWDEKNSYPRDIHAAANGILLFTYIGDLTFARRILDWTLENLYTGGGRFYFRKHRFYTKRATLMRWCQAWMAFAISELQAAAHGVSRTDERISLGSGTANS